MANNVGTVATSTEASLRKSRSITNALGQLLRVDEPTATGGTADADLGTLSNPTQPTFYKYSPQGKMVEVTQGGQKRFFLYDSLGRLIRVRQPEQQVNTSLNLTDAITGNNQWTAGFSYDILGNVLTATDAKGVTITNAYDNANRVKMRSYSDATPPVSHFYDGKGLSSQQSPNYAKGKLTKVTSSVSETRYTLFDDLGRLTQSQQITDGQTYQSSYQYNLSGALIQETYPSGRVVKNEFETDGDLKRIFGNAPNQTEKTYANGFNYTADGKIQRLRLGNGRWESAKFNDRLQVTELALGASNGDGGLWKLAYEYGELNTDGSVNIAKNTGNIAKQTVSFNGLAQPLIQAYKYDSLYRLTEARETSGSGGTQTWKQTFGYDRFGNRTAFSQIIGSQQLVLNNINHPSIDATTNRFTTGQDYTFDFNGNLIQDAQGRQFTFNGENKQTIVRNQSNQPIGTYFYDGDGKRVKKEVYANGQVSETTIFVYSAGKLVAEYSTAAPPTNPTTSYTATDQLGSPRVITNAFGQVTSRRDFMPFGEELYPDTVYRKTSDKYGATDSVRQRFTSYEKDTETGLDFAEARYYNNQHGRFTAVDPLLASGKSANPQTFNRYAYVLGNPIRLTDPTGLQVGCDPTKAGNCQVTTSASDFSFLKQPQPGDILGTQWKNTSRSYGQYGSVTALEETLISQPSNIGDRFGQLASDTVRGGGGTLYNGVAAISNGFGFIANRMTFQYFVTGQPRNEFQSVPYYEPSTPGEQSAAYATTFLMMASGGFTSSARSTSFSGFSTEVGTTSSIERFAASEFKFTDEMRSGSLRRNADSIFKNGVQEPVQYTVINGEKYLLDGNHRTLLASKFGQTVPAQRQSLPFGSFRDEADVLFHNDLYGNPFSSKAVKNLFRYNSYPKQ